MPAFARRLPTGSTSSGRTENIQFQSTRINPTCVRKVIEKYCISVFPFSSARTSVQGGGRSVESADRLLHSAVHPCRAPGHVVTRWWQVRGSGRPCRAPGGCCAAPLVRAESRGTSLHGGGRSVESPPPRMQSADRQILSTAHRCRAPTPRCRAPPADAPCRQVAAGQAPVFPSTPAKLSSSVARQSPGSRTPRQYPGIATD